MQVRSVILGAGLGAFVCLHALAQTPADSAAFDADSWPGSPDQAALLATESKDREWSRSMETRIVEGLLALEEWETWEKSGLRVECRTSICGIVFDLVFGSPGGGNVQALPENTAEVSAPLRKLFRELGFSAFSNVISFNTDSAGDPVADIEWTAIEARDLAPRGATVERLLAPGEGATR